MSARRPLRITTRVLRSVSCFAVPWRARKSRRPRSYGTARIRKHLMGQGLVREGECRSARYAAKATIAGREGTVFHQPDELAGYHEPLLMP